jgi:DNA polymerase III epsilon subunit-like protein
MSFVIFDTEYTSWKGCLEHGWVGNQKKEIVQIAAIKVSDKLEVLGQLNLFCKPLVNPVLSDYFVKLTNITNECIDEFGVSFNDAYNKFKEFVGDDICLSHVWGKDYYNEGDGNVIKENLDLYNIECKKDLVYRNVATIFKDLYQKNNIEVVSQSSGQIASILKLEKNLEELGINPHNALYDVFSILEGLKHFRKDFNLNLLK